MTDIMAPSQSIFSTIKPLINRVVVTGVGAVTPLGLTMEETWNNALRGQSGIGLITRFDTTPFDVKIAGEVKNFNSDLYIEKKEQKKMDLFIHYALAAAKMALEDSQLIITDSLKQRIATFIGTGIGGLPIIEEQVAKLLEKGPDRLGPFFIPSVIANMAAGHVTLKHGFQGGNFSVTSACATGAHSIGIAFDNIRLGRCDIAFAGGTESTVSPAGIGGFSAMRALSRRNDAPEKASRPWDQGRDGFVLAEGAAVLVLESLQSAIERGANILCEITGFGMSSDAYHITTPAPLGAGAQLAMRAALREAGLLPEAIHYINAHGTSTPVGDNLEGQAISAVFGDHAARLMISSTKSMMGHTLGAAGAIESAMCIYALRDQKVPPTINLDIPDSNLNLDFVPHQARAGKVEHTLNNSFGFGGTNACLIFSQFKK